MTFQPPPPGGNPPPPPGGQSGPPARPSGASGFDPKSVNPLDWAIIGAGALIFIFSFIDYYTYSGKGEFSSSSVSWSAWHGFFGWFAMLLALIGSAAVAIVLFAPQIKLPVPARLAGLGAYAVALLCLVLAIFVVPDYLGGGSGYDDAVDEGHGFGFWASLLLVLVAGVASLMRLQATGGQLPGALSGVPNIGGYGPQGGINGPAGAAPGYGGQKGGYGPPQGGYGPPPSAPPAPGPGSPPPSQENPPPPPAPGYGPPR